MSGSCRVRGLGRTLTPLIEEIKKGGLIQYDTNWDTHVYNTMRMSMHLGVRANTETHGPPGFRHGPMHAVAELGICS